MGKPILETRNIRKQFGGVIALRGVDFSLYPGEVVGLIGDNGAGKSTFVKIISGALRPDEGAVYFMGKEVEKGANPKKIRELGVETVYQNNSLVEALDSVANIFLGREITWFSVGHILQVMNQKRMEKEASLLLEGLAAKIQSTHVPVRNLSGGQRQAVVISRALYTKPKVIIFDEPTAGLGVKETRHILDLIVKLKSEGVSAIFISHVLEEVFHVADRIVVFYRGTKAMDSKASCITMEEAVKAMVRGCIGSKEPASQEVT